MSWETDLPPIVYLERRIKYYKKKIGNAKNWPTDQYFVGQYGKKEMIRISKKKITHWANRVKEYEQAIEILKSKS